jgi:tetratricopeptide (TPR) repeat protein
MSHLTGAKARTLSDSDPGIYNNIGVTYVAQKNEPAAIKEFKTAIKLDPTNIQANLNLGFVALNSGDYELAKACFEPVVKQHPGNDDAQLGYAVSLRGLKDYDAAGKIYESLLQRQPTNRTVVFNAATLHEKYTKKFDKSLAILEAYQKAMAGQLSPNDELYARIEAVRKSEDAEKERKRIEEQKAKEAREREERAKKLLVTMADDIKKLEGDLARFSSCIDPDSIDMVGTIIEQAKGVIEAQDSSMATDVQTFVDQAKDMMVQASQVCGSTAPEPAPAPAPAPGGGLPAPAPETPAPPPAPAPSPAPAPDAPAPAPQ